MEEKQKETVSSADEETTPRQDPVETEEEDTYVPRTPTQLWAARLALLVFILFVIWQVWQIYHGFR